MKVNVPETMSSELAEEIGWHLGDGSMNFYKDRGFYQLRGHMEEDKEHYESRIKPLFKMLYSINPSMRYMSKTGVFGFQLWSDELITFKESLGLPLGKKRDFVIPDIILLKEEWKKAFVRGFFDTDGCLYIENKRGKPYPRIEMGCVSERFIKQLYGILSDFDFKPTICCEKRGKKGWHDLWRIRMNGIAMAEKWFHEIRPMNPKFKKKWWARGDLNSRPPDG